MMKSILVFVTVCCLSAAAPAGLQFLSDGIAVTNNQMILVDPGIVNFSIVGSTACGNNLAILSGDAVFKGPVCPIEFWPEPCIWPVTEIDWNGDKAWMMAIFCDIPEIEPGKIRTVSFDMIVSGRSTLDILDVNFDPLLQVNYNIPEPATLALFGVGMLLIRRNKLRR
jgi:hypothetical protein